jgi:DNA-directed RNA polymerase subunit L
MEPTTREDSVVLTPLNETENDLFQFRLAGLNVSLANALRRVIQDHIPSYVFDVSTCVVDINTGRLHNEILKQRLQGIPIHKLVDVDKYLSHDENANFFDNYVVEVDVQNTTEEVLYVTTADFNIVHKSAKSSVSPESIQRIFPKHEKTDSHIIFARLRPRISDNIPGEHLKLTCGITIGTADENGSFSAVCCSSYGNTVDAGAADEAWNLIADSESRKGTSAEEIAFLKKNFDILDRQRYFVPNSFDFSIESVGVYKPRTLCKMACKILANDFASVVDDIVSEGSDICVIRESDTAMKAFDFVLLKGDYTIGKTLEYFVYRDFFDVADNKERTLQFCGFKRFHPHDSHAVLRISFVDQNAGASEVRFVAKEGATRAKEFFEYLLQKF